MELKIGTLAPDFDLQDQYGVNHKLSDYRGKRVVLYFYPEDDTPGCTTQACSFRDNFIDYKSVGITVIGISKDTVESHAKFAEKYELPFTLLADPEHQVSEAYGVWGEKSFMGKKFMGINRTTFLIDDEGKLKEIMPKVDPKGHAEDVLAKFSATEG
ncbi:MAG TPA: thioredoxin-dependent thiol peroxidase [Anaerolineaceae bacterium]|nr:thioredoxin-dependent thiol peroxidase [Anaerolineaceae bacterium]